MVLSLFDRIFRQPTSIVCSPDENLTTEILAFFLDHSDPFRTAFLKRCCPEWSPLDGATWVVSTQERLAGTKADAWHGMIPDIRLEGKGADGKFVGLLLVEVKIDAAPTYDSRNEPQTKGYKEYLSTLKNDLVRLVALTRWTPEPRFLEHCDCRISFADLVSLLQSVEGGELAMLAGRWAEFLQRRRWVMPMINQEHIKSIRLQSELERALWDAVRHAEMEICSAPWVLVGKASRGGLWEGRAIWSKSLKHSNGSAKLQLGVFYGIDSEDQIAIQPIMFVRSNTVAGVSPDDGLQIVKCPWSGPKWESARIIVGGNLVGQNMSGALGDRVCVGLRDLFTHVVTPEFLAGCEGVPDVTSNDNVLGSQPDEMP